MIDTVIIIWSLLTVGIFFACIFYLLWFVWMKNSRVADERNEDNLIELELLSTMDTAVNYGCQIDEASLGNENHQPIMLSAKNTP